MPPSNEAYRDDDLVSGRVAAKIAGVHPNTLYRWVHSGAIPQYRTPGGKLQVKVADVRARLTPTTQTGAA